MDRSLIAGVLALALSGAARGGNPVVFVSLLSQMIDRDRAAMYPEPAYTCRQFSSFDPASTSPNDPAGWFANGDVDHFIRAEQVRVVDALGGSTTRTEWVMAEMDGPGAIVRIWSANPAGTMRVYLDGEADPVIEAPMQDLLGGKWRVGAPLSQESSRGWNLYLPIPYGSRCKVTSDQRGFYYQVNYRTYSPETQVSSLTEQALEQARPYIERVQAALLEDERLLRPLAIAPRVLGPGEAAMIVREQPGPAALTSLRLTVSADDPESALRATVIEASFDGERTIWAPVGDFFGSGVGANPFRTWWMDSDGSGTFTCRWVMPFRESAEVLLRNLSGQPVRISGEYTSASWDWNERSMHFWSTWRGQYPITTAAGRGVEDWNYVEIAGKGVYMGDALSVMNPVEAWWGEGDEKIYVDGEAFPSHFGTGTEDYYGYAWCSPVVFAHPFHAQARCDGQRYGNNRGHTTVSRIRSLDAIPFGSGLKFDMEVWHWAQCEVAYAATTWFYAIPGAATNRPPTPAKAARAIAQPPPLPPPLVIQGAIECENLPILSISEGTTASPQGGFGPGLWSEERHLWVRGRAPGDFVELEVRAPSPGRWEVELYATRSWDYGIVRASIDGDRAGPELDLFNGGGRKVLATGAISLGEFDSADGRFVLRIEVVGQNPASEGTGSFFGLDCLALTPVR